MRGALPTIGTTLLRHLYLRQQLPSPRSLPPVAASGSHHDFAGGCGLDQHATSVAPTTLASTGGAQPGVAKARGVRPRGSRGREKAGEMDDPGAEERAGGQHPRSPPHRSILYPPPENSPRLSRTTVARRATRLSYPIASCGSRPLPCVASERYLPAYLLLYLTLLLAFSLKGKRVRGYALIPSRPSRTMLEHGPSPPRGISLGGDLRDGIVSVPRVPIGR